MKIRFWGVRGSLLAPLSADTLSAKMAGEHELQPVRSLPPVVGGNTPCVSVQVGDVQLILDGGSGLRALGADLMRGAFGAGRGRAHLFLSHTHWDHIQGLPFFAPLFVEGNVLDIYGGHAGLRDRLVIQQRPEFFPVALDAMRQRYPFTNWAMAKWLTWAVSACFIRVCLILADLSPTAWRRSVAPWCM